MTKFALFWKDGKSNVISGTSFANALINNGYKLSDVPNIQCYLKDGSESDMTFIEELGKWVRKTEKERV